MQFFLFDVSATLVFLVGYLAVAALQQRFAVPVLAGVTHALSREARTAPSPAGGAIAVRREAQPVPQPVPQPQRKWPRLSYPR